MNQSQLDIIGSTVKAAMAALIEGRCTLRQYAMTVAHQLNFMPDDASIAGLECPFGGGRYSTLEELAVMDAECAALDAMHLALHPVKELLPDPPAVVMVSLSGLSEDRHKPELTLLDALVEIERLRKALYASYKAMQDTRATAFPDGFVFDSLGRAMDAITETLVK